jgi:predicted transcriptional regulator
MTRIDLIDKIIIRKKELKINNSDLARLSNVGNRTISRFLNAEDVKLSTVEKVTNLLGLDFTGNEVIDIKTIKEKRATQKALYIVGLVQDTLV